MPTSWRWQIIWAVLMVQLVIAVYTVVYKEVVRLRTGQEIPLARALQSIVEALTTAGFGGDTNLWANDVVLNLFIVVVNLTGVVLVFMAVPGFLIPLLQRRLTDAPPQSTNLTNHVIICSYSRRVDTLIAELEAAGISYIVITDDPDRALDLNDEGTNAMYGTVDRKRTLEAANAELARALVANASDVLNPSVILSAKDIDETLDVVSVAESRDDMIYHQYAGADKVIRPRQVLGYSLGKRAARTTSRQLQDAIELGDDVEISEVVVDDQSPLAGQTLGSAGIREQIGATVIGVWTRGEFIPAPGPNVRIEENAILLVAGTSGDLEGVAAQTTGQRPSGGDIMIAGYGEVGRAVLETSDQLEWIEYTIIDQNDDPAVDVVGDVTDEDTVRRAGIDTTESVVLALDDDTTAIRATLVLERIAPEVEVIARANDRENATKLYRAGAEYVLAISTVTGRMLASALTEDKVLAPEAQVQITRATAPALSGMTLAEAAIRERTGTIVVAVERDGALLTDLDAAFELLSGDKLIIAGTDEACTAFRDIAGAS